MSNKMWGGRFTERPDAIMEEMIGARLPKDIIFYVYGSFCTG